MKFIVDSMLGRVARWLRLLGYDTLYYSEIEDRLLLRIAREENRILLTKNTHLIKVRELQKSIVESKKEREERAQTRYFLVNENDPFKQLKTIITAFNLKDFSLMSRCAECNTLLINVSKGKIKNLVPEYVYQTSDIFKECPDCSKLYWKGTHPEKFMKKLSEILGNDFVIMNNKNAFNSKF